MSWASSPWLLGLLPWAAVAAYLWAASGRPRGVPFLSLWRTNGGAGRRAAVGRHRPPAGVVVAVAAMLAAVLAGGRPGVRGQRGRAVVVLDRSVGGPDGAFGGTVPRAAGLLGGRPAQLVCVPAAPDGVGRGDWAAAAAAAGPTGVDTAGELDGVVNRLLRDPTPAGPVLVLSRRAPATSDPRVTWVPPDPVAGHIGIRSVAARDRPAGAVMVRLANGSDRTRAVVRVRSGSATVDRDVTLPPPGTTGNVFVDVPGLGESVSVEVDATAMDGRAWLARDGGPVRVVATPGVPAAVRRMADVFDAVGRGDSGGDGGTTVVLSDRPVPAGRPGVWVVDAGPRAGGQVRVWPHPAVDGVAGWAGGGAAVPGGFAVVASVAGRPVVAVREGPRQVWADLDEAAMCRSPGWVIFLADAFRWAGGGGGSYTASTPRPLGREWDRVDDSPTPAGVTPGTWPGLYRSSDGRLLAVNAADRPPAGPVGVSGELPAEPAAADLSGPLAALAVGGLAVAAVAWPGGPRRSRRRRRIRGAS